MPHADEECEASRGYEPATAGVRRQKGAEDQQEDSYRHGSEPKANPLRVARARAVAPYWTQQSEGPVDLR